MYIKNKFSKFKIIKTNKNHFSSKKSGNEDLKKDIKLTSI